MNKDYKKRNPVAQELRTPKYKSRVVQDKRDKYKKDLSLKDVIEQVKDFLERDKLLRQAKSLVNDHE